MNLDSVTAQALMDLMIHLNQDRGITFVMATHDGELMRRAKKLLWLRDGQIDPQGAPKEVVHADNE